MNALQQRADRAVALVQAIQTPEGAPLFAEVNAHRDHPIATYALPAAILNIDSVYPAFEAILVYDVPAMLAVIDALASAMDVVDWVGITRYEVQSSMVYCIIPFSVRVSDLMESLRVTREELGALTDTNHLQGQSHEME